MYLKSISDVRAFYAAHSRGAACRKLFQCAFSGILVFCLSAVNTPATAAEVDSAAKTMGTVSELADEFPLSALSREELVSELAWFRGKARPLAGRIGGRPIRCCSEILPVHEFERDVLAPFFEKLTGIKIQHDVIHEGEVVNAFSEQISTGRKLYHDFILDVDNIGLITRSEKVLNLTRFMKEEAREFTSSRLDLQDFFNLKAAQDYSGDLYQLPDQSFPILYWYRHDWFSDTETRSDFKKAFGRELEVPETWREYEEVAEFFTGRKMINPDGSEVKAYGHLDYYKVGDVSLGWRIADVQLVNAGVGDPGLPNGIPVDEYGIRVEKGIPVGASVRRGGALDGPAAIYAVEKYLEWSRYAPPEAKELDWLGMGKALAEGNIAQTIYFCSVFTNFDRRYTEPGPLCDGKGQPVWRATVQPRGKYWSEGMKIGYKDIAGHTICRNVRNDYRLAAWLWAQFCTSKIVSVAKFKAGVTPVRSSTLEHEWIRRNSFRWGGIVEFYLSDTQRFFTGTGMNVPHYPAIAALWYKYISEAVQGRPVAEVMTSLAEAVEDVLMAIKLPRNSPRLNIPMPQKYWLDRPGAPKASIDARTRGEKGARISLPAETTGKSRPRQPVPVVCFERFPDVYRIDGEVQGLQVEFVRKAFRNAGYEPEFTMMPRKRCELMIAEGIACAMFPVAYEKRMTEISVLFPENDSVGEDEKWRGRWRIMQTDYLVVTHSDYGGPEKEYDGDIKNLPPPVRIIHGEPFSQKLVSAGKYIQEVRLDRQNFAKLLREKTGCIITPSFIAEEIAASPRFADKLYIHDRPFTTRSSYLAFSAKCSHLSAGERLEVWKSLREISGDHVALNIAWAKASKAAARFK